MSEYVDKLKDKIRQLESDESFIKLSKKYSALNLFEILGATKAEIRHSNFLAWLLDPKGTHGLQDGFLRAFAAKLGQEYSVPQVVSDCVVRREWQHIDLLVICESGKYLLCIENKVFSREHGNQLQRYREILKKEYPGYSISFAFLTPDGISPEKEVDQQDWQPISYTDVLDAISKARKGVALSISYSFLLLEGRGITSPASPILPLSALNLRISHIQTGFRLEFSLHRGTDNSQSAPKG